MAAHRSRVRKKKLPEAPVRVTIESMTHDGRGVAHVDGKAVFIDAALPGEEVEFIYTDSRKDFAEGRVSVVHQASPQRVEALCPHYAQCGGCSFQHVADAEQIVIKEGLLQEQFKRIGKVEIQKLWEPLLGPHWGYRTKARMGVKYVAKKGRVLVGFRERRQQFLADIERCKVMHPIVGEQLPALSELIGQLSIHDKIPQIEVAVGEQETVLAIRVLEAPSAEDKQKLKQFSVEHGITLCLQSKGPDTIEPLDGGNYRLPSYSLPDFALTFEFKPTMFTQVNYAINRLMIQRAIDALELNEQDEVLDLFCGLGNFTLPLARKAKHVVGVEGDQPLVDHAWHNARLNLITNVEFYAADLSRDISQAAWANRKYDKLLLDPSRAGASEVLPNLKIWQPRKIVYVSCNPSTLARDAGILVNELGYTLIKAGVMDMFPQTAHVESIALFERSAK